MPATDRGEELLAAAASILPWMVEIRRDLHRHPELGLEEHRTARQVQTRLDELEIEHRDGIGGTGVLGLLSGDPSGPAVALRADLDALPIQDAKDVPYRSQETGRMHACGHDVHTAIQLGAARLLAERAGALAGTVKLLFQPAEETVGGARLLIEAGVLQNPAVRAIFGLHVEPGLAVGSVGLHYGQRNASSDDLRIVIHGSSGHAAETAGTVDAVVTAAHVITALQSVVSRNVDARESAVVSLGTIHGGAQANIVADRVELVGTIRTLDPEVRRLVGERAREVAESVAAGLGARAEVEIQPSYDPLINDDDAVDQVRQNAQLLLGEEQIHIYPKPNLGVEDFAFYLQHVPGAFYALGVRNESAGIVYPEHHERFDVDEECMAIGAALQAMNAIATLKRSA